ncbi:hypothetical protein RQP46_001398 [Phenoliferia psychrophenolica]
MISNNQLGPAGEAPSGAQQQRLAKRLGEGLLGPSIPPGQWADGLSFACKESTAVHNVITDSTDGGIVLFGAPGSLITGNTIVANTRVGMGGINMVDVSPFAGSFSGTQVLGNTLFSNTSMIKVGIAYGSMVWGSNNASNARTFDGVVNGNTLHSGSPFGLTPGYFAFGIAVAGVNNATVLAGNRFRNANFGGVVSSSCTSTVPPTPGPLYFDPSTSPGAVLMMRPGFKSAPLEFLICLGPTAMMSQIDYSS